MPGATQRYEALRAWALSGVGDRAVVLGVGVLLHRGVACWLEVALELEPAPGTTSTAQEVGSLTRPGAPLVACLARMVVSNRRCLA